jgi:hypothetical protein
MKSDLELKYLVGMVENAAIKVLDDANIYFRVTRRDNIFPVCLRDVRVDRVNLEIDSNKISKAFYG